VLVLKIMIEAKMDFSLPAIPSVGKPAGKLRQE
jgi:hypothetical protein